MNRAAAAIYIFWSLMLIGAAIYIMHQMNDLSNPTSFRSSLKHIEETLSEDPSVP